MTPRPSAWSRRETIFGIAAAGVVPGTVIGTPQPNDDPTAVDLPLKTRDPDQNLIAYMKSLSDLAGRPTWRFHAGRILAVATPGDIAQPFMDFVACKQDRVRRLRDGSYQYGYRGVILFTELDTGRVLDRFDNPITGVTNEVNHFYTKWGSGVYTRDGSYSLAAEGRAQEAPGLEDQPFQLGWSIVDDDVYLTYDERVAVRTPEGRVVYADNSMYRYHVSLAQLANPSVSSADAIMSWDTTTTWWPWMEMDERPGHLIFGSMGKKYDSLDRVPSAVVDASEERFPGQLTRPIDWSDYTLPDPALVPS